MLENDDVDLTAWRKIWQQQSTINTPGYKLPFSSTEATNNDRARTERNTGWYDIDTQSNRKDSQKSGRREGCTAHSLIRDFADERPSPHHSTHRKLVSKSRESVTDVM